MTAMKKETKMLRDLFDDIDYEIEMKTFDEYEEEAMNTAVYDDDLIYPLIGLVSEAGEVADKFKKLMRDEAVELPLDEPSKTLTLDQRTAIAHEIGDVLWYCTALANDIGFSLEDIASMNIEKLKDRKDRDMIHGSGDER